MSTRADRRCTPGVAPAGGRRQVGGAAPRPAQDLVTGWFEPTASAYGSSAGSKVGTTAFRGGSAVKPAKQNNSGQRVLVIAGTHAGEWSEEGREVVNSQRPSPLRAWPARRLARPGPGKRIWRGLRCCAVYARRRQEPTGTPTRSSAPAAIWGETGPGPDPCPGASRHPAAARGAGSWRGTPEAVPSWSILTRPERLGSERRDPGSESCGRA